MYLRSPHGLPVPKGHPVQEAADLEGYRPPTPKRKDLLLLDLARERFKGQVALFWLMRGTFVRSWRLAGMQNLMVKMIQSPEFVHRIASMVMEYNLLQLDMLADAGLDVLVVEDDIATTGATLISPRHFQEFVNPYNRRIVQRAHSLGLKWCATATGTSGAYWIPSWKPATMD